MNFLFILAMMLLPLDNWAFAPSNGWATITPIIFFIYIIINFKYLFIEIRKYKMIIYLYVLMGILSAITFMFSGINIGAVIDTVYGLVLGLCNLFAFDIYFVQKKNGINKISKILVFSYTLSFIIGCLQFVAIKYNVNFIYSLFEILFKRNYMFAGRVQFTFTEPSYIGMHIFGVLLPLYLLTKDKKIIRIVIMFGLSSLIFNASVRFLLDIVVIFSLLLFSYFVRNKKIFMLIMIVIFSILLVQIAYNTNSRIKNIVNNGVYSDNSLASRYFRINASIYGYKTSLFHFTFGYGMGNSILPIRSGYYKALMEYRNNYLVEVRTLGESTYHDSSASFCLYIRLISEFGIYTLLFIMFYIKYIYKRSRFKYKPEYLLLIMYLYLQFDSYSFYALWLFIFIITNTKDDSTLKLN